MKKLTVSISIFFLCLGCSNQSVDLPEQIKNLENVTVYPADAQPAYDINLEKEISIGTTDEVLIGRIHGIAVDSSGRVFIGDIQKQVIHVFNPNGRFLRQLGRSGKGPGEFTTLREVQIRNNFLYAYDPNQQKVSQFTLDSLVGVNTISLAGNKEDYQALNRAFPRIENLYVRNNQTYLAEFIIHPVYESKPWENVEYKSLFYLLDNDGNISKNLFGVDQIFTVVGALTDNIKVFFGRPMIVLSSDNNIYVSEESDYFLIKIYNPSGTYLRAFFYPHSNIPLTKKSASEGGITGTHFRNEFLLKHMKSIDLPQNWPVLTDMKIDDQDRLWVATTVKDMKVYQWWVLNPDGKLIARFNWPRSKPIQLIKNSYLYTRETEKETGIQQIAKYRIEME